MHSILESVVGLSVAPTCDAAGAVGALQAMERIHAILPDGTIVKDIEVFRCAATSNSQTAYRNWAGCCLSAGAGCLTALYFELGRQCYACTLTNILTGRSSSGSSQLELHL